MLDIPANLQNQFPAKLTIIEAPITGEFGYYGVTFHHPDANFVLISTLNYLNGLQKNEVVVCHNFYSAQFQVGAGSWVPSFAATIILKRYLVPA